MPLRRPCRLAAVLTAAALAITARPAAARAADQGAHGTGDGAPLMGAAAVDQVIDIYAAVETAWRVDLRCRLLETPARRQLDWLEDTLDQVVRQAFRPETRARIGVLAARTSRQPPFAACNGDARAAVLRILPAAAELTGELTDRHYAGAKTYRAFLADGYFQARTVLAVDARCRGDAGKPAAEPDMRAALGRTAVQLASMLGEDRVAKLDADAADAVGDGECGAWLGQAVVDATARLDRLGDELSREAAAAAGDDGLSPVP